MAKKGERFMKKKILSILITILAVCTCMFTLTACGENEPPHTHTYSVLKYDTENHWYECSCGEKKDIENHKGGTATETSKAVCSVCEQEYGESLGHVHTFHLTKVDAKPQSCTATGNIEYYTCSCGKWFTDNTATTEITDKTSVVIAKDDHKYETLKKTATEHWYECSCGAYETKENHKGGTATCQVKATCSVCDTVYGDFAEHEPKTAWVITDTHHYHECVYNCGEKLNYSEHSFTNYVSNKDATYESDGTKTAQCDGGCGKTHTVTDVGSMLIKDEIRFTTLNVDGKNVYGKVPNATTEFVFYEEIFVSGNATYVVDDDKSCSSPIDSKTVDLVVGDNIFYVLETVGNNVKLYTVTIYRRAMFTVTFNTNGGTAVDSQIVEEDSFTTAPTTTKIGYTFAGWDYDFATPITKDTTITASWTANTNTAYKVEYYLENLENDNYTLHTFENKTGTTNSTVYAEIKTFEHFMPESTSVSGIVNANGTTVIKVYYQRNEYTVTFDGNGGTLASGNATQTVKYGDSVVAPTFEKEGHTFVDFNKSLTNVSENYTITANWKVNQYTLTIVYDNGQENTVLTQDYGTAIENITEPTRDGYTFNGWDKIPSIMPAINTTITAKWLAIFNLSSGEITSLTSHGKTLTNIIIPSKIDNVDIISIGEEAFYNSSNLTSVEIPASVTSIGEYAFYGCRSLTKVNYTGTIDHWAQISFSNYCSNPLYYAKNLYVNGELVTQAKITTATKINEYAFRNCDSLTSILVDENNANYKSIDGNLYNKNGTIIIQYASGKTANTFTIPNSVTSIGEEAFYNCSNLTSIVIPDSVTSIGEYAFYGCSSLESITLPFVGSRAGVTSSDTYQYPFGYIFGTSSYSGSYSATQYYYDSSTSSTTSTTFYIPSSLKYVTITGGNILYGAFRNCASLTSVVIGDSVESIGDYAFNGCSSLTSVVIGDSVTSIGWSAFSWCYTLTSVVIGNGVTSIGNSAFYYCASLTSVEIGNSVKSIGAEAFYICTSLTSVVIPDSVTSIGDRAFSSCHKLVEVINKSSHITIEKGSSSNGYVGYYALAVYNSDSGITESQLTNDNGYIIYTEGNEKVLVGYNGTETELVLPVYITKINQYAFYSCDSLYSVVIGDSVTSIGSSAFRDCDSLTSVLIPNSVTSIGDYTFFNCDSLTSVVIPNSVTSIGNYAFENCYSLTSVTIGNSVTSIGKYVFYNCSSLTSISVNCTVAEWKAIPKGDYWYYYGPATEVICTDGTVAI